MTKERQCAVAVLGLLAFAAIAYAVSNSPDGVLPIPEYETEAQFMGVGLDSSLNPGTPLDLRAEVHFFAPGFNPRDVATLNQKPVTTRVRYPMTSGANVSTVMHKGWSGFQECSPDKDWFYAPPEAAVL